ncbi:MAG: OmpA family protein [Muribaculaceae bacterium]|nr:OmpA family protein [Muribaculaceae bacterium]MDE5924265.1 OmpA family protein [Muribaculaceae bacterium]
MKNLWKTLSLLIAVAVMAIAPLEASADKNDNLDDMSFAEILNSVDLGKQVELVQKFQDREAKNVLFKNRYIGEQSECSIDAIRNREVIVVSIPAHLLFGPNQTELLETASRYLEPFKRYMSSKDPDMYRVLAVMHTDNTGSEEYREQLTVDRAQAVSEWFEENAPNTQFLFPFAMADDMPLVPNDSFENRDKNRRLEIYLVPGEAMLEKAKKGRIAF